MTPPDDQFTDLLRMLLERIPVRTPVWTDGSDGDPGITLVTLIAYLVDRLDGLQTPLPDAARAELARIGARLVALDRSDDPVEVQVDGVCWSAVSNLSNAAADADVFALDRESGEIQFGDGVHGRRPPDGSTIAATYRQGRGTARADVTFTSTWPFTTGTYTLESRDAGFVRVARAAGVRYEPNDALERLTYFNGRLLSADDLQTEQDYFRTRLRRLQRAALTVGVISGLELSVSDDADGTPSVVIAPGLALDRAGELIEVCEPVSIPLGEASEPGLVLLRYVERPTALLPATGSAPDSAESPQPGRIAEGFGISISPSVDGAAVALGRLVRESTGWRVESAPLEPR
jgi:hypothetical protein